jgi:hypothetical protein
MKNERKVFGLYAEKTEERKLLKCPFIQNGYVYASDGYILIRVRESAVKRAYKSSNLLGCSSLFTETDGEESITLDRLKTLLSAVKKVEETKTVGENIECEECGGSGEVEWEYNSYTRVDECPVCGGSGYSKMKRQVPTGKIIADPCALINLGDKTFAAKYIEIIAQTMGLLKVNKVTMLHNASRPHEKAVFKFNEDVDALLVTCI